MCLILIRWGLGKHIHDDHVARLVVDHEEQYMSSNLVGIEVHGVISWIELISVVLSTGLCWSESSRRSLPTLHLANRRLVVARFRVGLLHIETSLLLPGPRVRWSWMSLKIHTGNTAMPDRCRSISWKAFSELYRNLVGELIIPPTTGVPELV